MFTHLPYRQLVTLLVLAFRALIKLSIPQYAMSGPPSHAGVVPANLSFLAIYNPSLSHSDESLRDQIVYYYSKIENEREKSKRSGHEETEETQEEINERLRQIGLAQGMVQFAE